MKSYTFPVTVKRDGRSFAPGEAVPLEAGAAEKLVPFLGGRSHAGAPRAEEPVKKPEGSELVSAVAKVIAAFDQNNEELFTSRGLPVVAAIEQVLGYDISAADRDEAVKLLADNPDLFSQ